MSEDANGKKKRHNGFIRFCAVHKFSPVFVVVGIIVIIALLTGTVFWGVSTISLVESTTTDLGLKRIGELATQAGFFTNVQDISNSREVFGVTVPFTQSNYIYSYDGIIKVGYDFEAISVATDETEKKITVHMPEPIVISNDVIEDSLKVYIESRSIYTPLKLEQINSSQKELKEEVLNKAISNGIFDQARTNAEILISGFLSASFNLQDYSIVFE